MKVRPDFCTIVMPDEYDYVGQFEDSVRSANKFHGKHTVDEKCPPPYFPLDMGKVCGLILEIERLKERIKELE